MRKSKLVLLTAAGVVVIVLVAPLIAMIAGASGRPAEDAQTVILLGFKLEENDAPAPMMQARCRAAADYLLAHPRAICVATGGKTGSGARSEAEVMRDLLVGMGVDGERVLLEPRAANTGENLALSAALLRQHGVTGPVVIVTNGFHQYRAGYFARKNGLEPTPLCCESEAGTTFLYGCREMLAVYKAWALQK